MAYETWNARGGESVPIKPPRNQAEPATSAQLEELFTDWTGALWAIDFFKTRRTESVMRSFREIVFRAGLDGREASLLRAMGIEVIRYLERSSTRRILMGRSSAYWTSNLYVNEAEEPVPTAPLERLAAPLRRAAFAPCARACWASRASSEQVRFMGPTWQWAWEYGIGNRKLCWLALHAWRCRRHLHPVGKRREAVSPRAPRSPARWPAPSSRDSAPAR